MPELLDDILAEKTVRDYVCSNCWGHLLMFPAGNRQWRVECHNCGENTVGFVTKYYAEKRRSESIGELIDTREMLYELSILRNPHKGKSPEQLIKELGF